MSGFPFSFITDRILNINSDSGVKGVEVATELLNGSNDALFELLDGLSAGETILGKIISSDSNTYTFKTEDGITVNAKASNGVSLEPGSTILFEVNKASSNSFSLRPLNVNTNTRNTAESALKAASIPVNPRTLEMTMRNMELGNPIDKKAILNSYRDVMLNEDIPVKYIVELQEMNIPVTKENLSSYEEFLNMRNNVVNKFNDITDALADSFADLINLDSKDFSALKPVNINQSSLVNADVSTAESRILNEYGDSITNDLKDLKNTHVTNENGNLNVNKNDFQTLLNNLRSLSLYIDGAESVDTLDVITAVKNEIAKFEGSILAENVTSDEKKNSLIVQDFSKDFDFFAKENESFLTDNKPTEQTAFFDVNKDAFSLDLKEQIKSILEKVIVKNWTFEKDKIQDKASVKDLYEKLYSDTKKIINSLNEVLPKESPVVNLVNNLNSSIDFMNALNNFVPYVQIPLKGENGTKAMELYVFKNKHSSALGDELTAFVHLDTNNLGPTDVFVSLKGNAVNTHFTLETEESLKFIEKNLSFLDKRLTEKGYSFRGDMKLQDDFKSPVERMLENSLSKMTVANTSFDARI